MCIVIVIRELLPWWRHCNTCYISFYSSVSGCNCVVERYIVGHIGASEGGSGVEEVEDISWMTGLLPGSTGDTPGVCGDDIPCPENCCNYLRSTITTWGEFLSLPGISATWTWFECSRGWLQTSCHVKWGEVVALQSTEKWALWSKVTILEVHSAVPLINIFGNYILVNTYRNHEWFTITQSITSATTLVCVRNTRVFRTALMALTEPRTLWRRITR